MTTKLAAARASTSTRREASECSEAESDATAAAASSAAPGVMVNPSAAVSEARLVVERATLDRGRRDIGRRVNPSAARR